MNDNSQLFVTGSPCPTILQDQDFLNLMEEKEKKRSSERRLEELEFFTLPQSVPPISYTTPVSQKSFEKTKKMITTLREKVANYPKSISYEGSLVLCVLLSLNKKTSIHISNLPKQDQDLLKEVSNNKNLQSISVEFNPDKNFFITNERLDQEESTYVFINTVTYPQPKDLNEINGVVQIENVGDKVEIGKNIKLNKTEIKKLIGVESYKNEGDSSISELESDSYSKRQSVSGRNAYEIREDIIGKAMDIIERSKLEKNDPDTITNEVLKVATKLYKFVENKKF